MPWIPWQDRNLEFAPALGLHRLDPFYPISAGAFLNVDCDLKVLRETDESGPVFVHVPQYRSADFIGRIQLLNHPELNKPYARMPFLDRHRGRVDVEESRKLQRGFRRQVYVRGFRNTGTGEAYIVYWFFYVENFVPTTRDEDEIERVLSESPDRWWTHEGDWEGVSVRFTDYRNSNPTEAVFSQHEGSDPIRWSDVETDGGRMAALPALGTHATYNRPVSKRHAVIYAEIARADRWILPRTGPGQSNRYSLVEIEPGNVKHGWYRFKGRWGKGLDDKIGRAPTGPARKNKTHFRMLADRPGL